MEKYAALDQVDRNTLKNAKIRFFVVSNTPSCDFRLAALRIGHSYLTHCYLLKGEPQPFCVSCNEALTINHLLTNCAEFADSRRKHYSTNTLEEVLTSANYAHVLSFLKEINLYKKV